MAKGKAEEKSGKYAGTCVIVVMGPTGAGKSSFINQLFEKQVVKVGHSLQTCTVDLQPVPMPTEYIQRFLPLWNPESQNGAQVIIVDTPGADNDDDDVEILKRVSDLLAKTYGKHAKLVGVIFLQDICRQRSIRAIKPNFEVFDKLCGEGAGKYVVLGTTQWGRLHPNDIAVAMEHERQLQDNFWKDMIKKGSTMRRVDDKDTNASPWNLVETVVYKYESSMLRIQRELIDMEYSFLQSNFPPMILVLGMTGAEKSTFICSAGAKNARPRIHKGLISSQEPVEEFEVESEDGRTVSLVDTPGFNNTVMTDEIILDEIIAFLKSRKQDRKVAGIIYLLNPSIRDYIPVSVDKIETPPPVVLVTVDLHADRPISNHVKSSLKSKYGAAYQEDHFGASGQYQTAWGVIHRVLDTGGNGVSTKVVIRNLEGILQNRTLAEEWDRPVKQLFQKLSRFRNL